MDEGRIRKIIHVDMDAFYASVEQRDEPTLKGKPVAVGYPAKRGVVAAASYEARRFGVRSAMPSTIAMRKCSELVFVPPRFDVYREVSKQIHAIFKDYTPLVEPLSLDEAYLDVTDNLKGIPTAWETAKEIRARIYDEIRLTASAGISCNKFLAKIASDYRKPNGQFAILPDEAEAFVAALPIAKFYGVGPKTAAKMHALGIETGADLRGQTLAFLQERFGKAGNWYFEIARAQDDRPVQPDRERKSSGSETTFPEDLLDPVRIVPISTRRWSPSCSIRTQSPRPKSRRQPSMSYPQGCSDRGLGPGRKAIGNGGALNGRQNVARHHARFFIGAGTNGIEARLRVGNAKELGPGPVDPVAENPPAVRCNRII